MDAATVTIQVGQAGNQIGSAFFKGLVEDGVGDGEWFSGGKARAVLVDMEPKVVESALEAGGRNLYDQEAVVTRQAGAANNWAHGWSAGQGVVGDEVLEQVRRKVEDCDRVAGMFVLGSLAGGTGSGLGTAIVGKVREEYGSMPLWSGVVWPYDAGEVAVQSYNVLLSTSMLVEAVDGVLVARNDDAAHVARERLGVSSVGFDDMNKIIAGGFQHVLGPREGKGSVWRELNRHVTPLPGLKLASVKRMPIMAKSSSAWSSYEWSTLVKHLRQMIVTDAVMEEGMNWRARPRRSVGTWVMARGADAGGVDLSSLRDPELYAEWSVDPLGSSWHANSCGGLPRSLSAVNNGPNLAWHLNGIVERAWNMYQAKAYLKPYDAFGVSEEVFAERFGVLEEVLRSYTEV